MKKVILLILGIHFFLLWFLRFTAWPEMILWPYLVNKGLKLYQDIVIIYPPVFLLGLSFLGKVFGVTLINLKIYTWILIIFSDLLVYWVAKSVTKQKLVGIISLVFYVLWQLFFEGNAMWFDLALAPLALGIFYFSFSKKYFFAGLLFGLALTFKQTAIWFFPPMVLTYWLFHKKENQLIIKFIIGTLVFPFIAVIYLIGNNLWTDFVKWAINFGIFYLPTDPGQIQLPTLKQLLALSIPFAPVFILSFLKENKKMVLIVIAWSLFASLGVYPRWEYFHFQPAIPFIAIAWGILFFNIKNLPQKNIKMLIPVAVIILMGTIYLQSRFYFLNWQKPTRFYDDYILETAKWIKNNTVPNEKIYCLNCWDHLYALSDTLPAVSPLIHTLPWHLEYPGMQEKYVSDLKVNKPRFVLFQPYTESGLGSYRPKLIDQFLQENYIKTKMIARTFWVLEPIK
jgi:hypothetical protein